MGVESEVFCEDLDYGILLEKHGREVRRGQETRLQSLSYQRVCDSISTAAVEIFVPDVTCAGNLSMLDYDNSTLTIYNQRDEMWYGRINRVRYRAGQNLNVLIEAEDLLSWLNRRLLRTDLIFTSPENIEEIALAIYNACVMSVDPPEAVLHTYLSGLTESREMLATQNRYGWSIMSEMLDTGLDVTTFGRQILFGMPKFGDPIKMMEKDVVGEVEVVKDGDDAGNFVVVDAQNDTRATFPAARQSTNGYPVVDVLVSDGQITDEQSALNAAKARYEWSAAGVRRVRAEGGLTLSPQSKIDPKKIIAGQPVTFQAKQCVYPAQETLRLGDLSIEVAAGVETATIQLQPLGSYLSPGNV